MVMANMRWNGAWARILGRDRVQVNAEAGRPVNDH